MVLSVCYYYSYILIIATVLCFIGALLLGSFGLWNAYVFGVVVLYTRIKSDVKLLNRSSQ